MLILFLTLFYVGNVFSIEAIVAPFFPWSFSKKLTYGDKVLFIYQKEKSTSTQREKFLLCEYPIIFSYALGENSPGTHCVSNGVIFKNREDLMDYLSLMDSGIEGSSLDEEKDCPKLFTELLSYHSRIFHHLCWIKLILCHR